MKNPSTIDKKCKVCFYKGSLEGGSNMVSKMAATAFGVATGVLMGALAGFFLKVVTVDALIDAAGFFSITTAILAEK